MTVLPCSAKSKIIGFSLFTVGKHSICSRDGRFESRSYDILIKMKKLKALIEKTVSLPTSVWVGIIAVIAAVTILLNTVFEVGCLMKAIFNVPCPVCGMTRAYLSLLCLDIKAAMRYNPAFPLFPIACLFGILSATDKKRTKIWLIAFFSAILLILIIWIIRLALGVAV